jgi:hypothetical protein
MPCLFALLVLWLFTPLMDRVFDTWIWPLLGIIFLPFTTLMYVFAAAPLGSANFWGWFCVFLGLLLDIQGWMVAYNNRQAVPGMATSY